MRRRGLASLARILAGGWVRILAVSLVVVVAALPKLTEGRRWGWMVERALPELNGRISIGGGHWTWGDLWAFANGRPAPFQLNDVRIADRDGLEVFRAGRLSGRVESSGTLVVRDLRVSDAAWRLAETQDGQDLGFVNAFERRAARGRAPPSSLRAVRLENVSLEDLDATFDLPGWALTLRRVWAGGQLSLAPSAGGAPVFTFDAHGVEVRGGGQIAVLDRPWRSVLPFDVATAGHIATTALAPDALRLDAAELVTGRSSTSLNGVFTGVFSTGGSSAPAGIDLAVHLARAGDALQAIARSHAGGARFGFGGAAATLDATFVGPLAAPTIAVRGEGLEVHVDAFPSPAVAFELEAWPARQRLRLARLAFASPSGGQLKLEANLDRHAVTGALSLQHFDAAPFLPTSLMSLAGGTWQGQLGARVDLDAGAVTLDRAALTVTRPPGLNAGPPVVQLLTRGASKSRPPHTLVIVVTKPRLYEGVLELPRVRSWLWGGQVTASGQVRWWDPVGAAWLPSPVFDLSFEASRLSVSRLIGSDFASGVVSLRARARGTREALAVAARLAPDQKLRLLGEWFHLPPEIDVAVDERGLVLAKVALRGRAQEQMREQERAAESTPVALTVAGRIDLSGQLGLHMSVNGFPLRSLPGLEDLDLPFDGHLEGDVHLTGPRSAPEVSGALSILDAHFQGRPIGGGKVVVTPAPRGGIRAHGLVIEGLTAEGSLFPAGGRTQGEMILRLAGLRLDPFLGGLPGGVTAAGVVSGVARAEVKPGEKPSIDGRLSELALIVTLPQTAGPQGLPPPPSSSPRVIAFHAESEVHISAQAGGGPLHMDRVRLAGPAGTLELQGDTAGGVAQGEVRGHLEVKALAPMAAPWLTLLGGTLAFDATASSDAEGLHPVLKGNVLVTTPIDLRVPQLPFDLQIGAGRVRLTERGALIDGLTVRAGRETVSATGRLWRSDDGGARLAIDLSGTVDPRLAETLARGLVREVEGTARLTAHVAGQLRAPHVEAHLDLGGIAFTLPSVATRVRFARGSIGADEHGVVSVEAGGAVQGLATPYAVIDDATFALRLTAPSARDLRLSGDVAIGAARVPPNLRRGPKTEPQLSRFPLLAPAASWGRALEETKLNLRLHSTAGAIRVEVEHLPAPRLDVEARVTGTLAHPEVLGHLTPKGVYSSLLLWLAGLDREVGQKAKASHPKGTAP